MVKRRSKEPPLLCGNPACGQPLDWAAPVYPKRETPKQRIHEVFFHSGNERYFMCYACGHYTVLRPPRIRIDTTNKYVHVVAESGTVSSVFLHRLLDEIEAASVRVPGHYLRLLLEVVAPEIAITPTQALEVFRRAVAMGLRGAQVAYVISGRPWSVTATLMERIARQRGLHLRFFVDRDRALRWLNAADEAGHSA